MLKGAQSLCATNSKETDDDSIDKQTNQAIPHYKLRVDSCAADNFEHCIQTPLLSFDDKADLSPIQCEETFKFM
jgi:hypothetical protein